MTGRSDTVMSLPSVVTARRRRTMVTLICSVAVLVFGLALASFARGNNEAQASGIALLVLIVAIVGAAIQPIIGLYAIVFFTLVGDAVTMTWFPFAKNLSSHESLLFLSNGLTLSPLEILVAITFLFMVIEIIGTPGARLVRGRLFGPTAVFTGFVVFGFLNGVGRGGDLRIALFEGRALFLILPVYLLVVNLCGPDQLRRLAWTAVAAVVINALMALSYLQGLSPLRQASREDLGEHPASVHFAAVVLLTALLFLYRGGSRLSRFVLLAACIPIVSALLAAQRRAAVIALGVGWIVVLLSLWWRRRASCIVIAPLFAVIIVGYCGAFWNSTSTAGFPAQAIKTVISPNSVSSKDRSSDLYRTVEDLDINFTIRTSPLLGRGFGQKFLAPVRLPDISFFEFYQYITHNSILWMWMKTGFGGFAAMLFMFAAAIRSGTRSLMSERDPTKAALIMMGICYVTMFAIFAFVDIAWDPRSMVFLGVSFALCSQSPTQPAMGPDRSWPDDHSDAVVSPAAAVTW